MYVPPSDEKVRALMGPECEVSVLTSDEGSFGGRLMAFGEVWMGHASRVVTGCDERGVLQGRSV